MIMTSIIHWLQSVFSKGYILLISKFIVNHVCGSVANVPVLCFDARFWVVAGGVVLVQAFDALVAVEHLMALLGTEL